MSLGLFVLRVVIGLLFVGHGAQKLFGAFGGPGLRGTAGFFDGLGLRPGHVHARVAGMMELGGGALLALGLFTPIGSAAVIAVMTAAVITVHFPKGLWSSNGGYEYNLVLAAGAFALAAVGAGGWSLDSAFKFSDHGALWGIVALVIGLLAGASAVLIGEGYRPERHPRPTQRPTAA
jgi:putative oxidoreductase